MKRPPARLGTRFVALMLLAMFSLTAPASGDQEHLGDFVEHGMGLWQVPGMAVTVVSEDTVLFRQGFGTTALVDGVDVDEHTLFAIASTTKAMIAAAVLMLADEGKLSLDDAIVKHIPELHFSDPLLTQQLLVRDLLAHRTGLPSSDFWTFFQGMPLDEQIRRLQSLPVAAPLRTRLIYQNTMFELAGLMIERVSAMPWDVFIRDRLWLPIGMTETFSARGQIESGLNHVMPYYLVDGQLTLADWDFAADHAAAAGSVWSSIHDMGLWAQFLLRDGVTAQGERLLSESAVEEMFTPQQLASPNDFYPTIELTRPNWRSYGLAWYQQDFQGRKIDFHTGSLAGLVAIIGLDRAGDRAVVVLGNRDHAEMRHAVLWGVMDNSPTKEWRDWNQEVFDLYQGRVAQGDEQWLEIQGQRLSKTRPSLPREDYLGKFEIPLMGEITITEEDGEMFLKTSNVALPMSYWHLDTFLVEYEPWDLREFAVFHIGPDGRIRELELFDARFQPIGTDSE